MTAFGPETHGFVRLRDFRFPGGRGVDVFEYCNHAAVDGRVDVLRLNIYLSKDGSFVTIWHGLLEPMLTEGLFELPHEFSFQEQYCEPLFRGYIETSAEAATILHALRLDRQSLPQVLSGGPHDLRCDILPTGQAGT